MPVFVGAGTSSFMKGGDGVGVSTSTTSIRNSLSGVRPGQLIFNTTTNLMEYYNGTTWIVIDTPPVVSSVNNTNITDTQIAAGFDLVITGSFFAAGATVKFIGNDGTSHTSPSVAVNSTTQITARVHTSVSNSNEPYDVQVTNQSGLSATLENAFNVNASPTWNTTAGLLATITDLTTGNHATLSASDSEGDTVSYTESASVLSDAGLALNSGTGIISGDPTNVNSSTTLSFTVNATSSGINTTARNFSLVVNPAGDGTSSSRPIANIATFNSLGTLSSVGYYDRWVNFNGAVTPLQQKLYYDGTDTWYVTSLGMGTQDGAMINGSAFGYQNDVGLGAFKAINIGRSHTRRVSGSGIWSYISNAETSTLIGTTVVASSGSQGSHPQGDSGSSPILLSGGNGNPSGWTDIDYYNHVSGANYSSAQETAFRNVVTQLNYKTAWMCIGGDDDGTGTSLSNVDWDSGSTIHSTNGNNGTPQTGYFRDKDNSAQKLQAGQSNVNEHMMVTWWTHNAALAVSSNSGGPNIMGDAGSGSYTGGMKTTTMIMPSQIKGEVGSSSTTWVSPLYNSTIGKLNNRLVLLYK